MFVETLRDKKLNMKELYKIYNTNLLLLLTANFVSCFGIGITQMYSLIYVYERTHSNFYAALQACAIFGSGIVASYLYALRSNHNNLLIVMLVAEICSGIAAIVMASSTSIYTLYCMLVVIYIFYGFSKPSFQTMLFRLSHDPAHIKNINATSSVLYAVALALGWLVSPLLFSKISFSGLFTLDAATYFISGLFIFVLIAKLREDKQLPLQSYAIHEGSESRNQLSLFNSYFKPANVFIFVAVLTIVFAAINGLEMGIFRSVYHLTDDEIGVFFAIWILAGGIAGLARKIPKVGSYSVKYLEITTTLLLISATLFSYSQNVIIGGILYSFCGFLYIYSDIVSNNYIYSQTMSSLHPKYFSTKNLVTNAVMLGSLPVMGYFADAFSISLTMIITVLISMFVLIANKMSIKKI